MLRRIPRNQPGRRRPPAWGLLCLALTACAAPSPGELHQRALACRDVQQQRAHLLASARAGWFPAAARLIDLGDWDAFDQLDPQAPAIQAWVKAGSPDPQPQARQAYGLLLLGRAARQGDRAGIARALPYLDSPPPAHGMMLARLVACLRETRTESAHLPAWAQRAWELLRHPPAGADLLQTAHYRRVAFQFGLEHDHLVRPAEPLELVPELAALAEQAAEALAQAGDGPWHVRMLLEAAQMRMFYDPRVKDAARAMDLARRAVAAADRYGLPPAQALAHWHLATWLRSPPSATMPRDLNAAAEHYAQAARFHERIQDFHAQARSLEAEVICRLQTSLSRAQPPLPPALAQTLRRAIQAYERAGETDQAQALADHLRRLEKPPATTATAPRTTPVGEGHGRHRSFEQCALDALRPGRGGRM